MYSLRKRSLFLLVDVVIIISLGISSIMGVSAIDAKEISPINTVGDVFIMKTEEDAEITYQVTAYDFLGKIGTVQIISGPGEYYYGHVTIPKSVSYQGSTYFVTRIADASFYNNYLLTY